MALEAGDGFISGLVATNPVNATDQVAQGDDHIRLVKTALKGTFPNLNGAVNFTPAQANILATDGAGAGMLADIAAIADPGADRVLGWDESANAAIAFSLSTGLTSSGTAILIDTAVVPRFTGTCNWSGTHTWTAGNHTFNDTVGVRWGTDADLTIFHSGAGGFIQNITGRLRFQVAGPTDCFSIETDGSILTPNLVAGEVGYKGTPFNAQAGNYTLVLTDAGKTIYKASGGAGETITIPANGSVAFPVGTQIDIVNNGGGDLTIAITTDTLSWVVGGAIGSRTLGDHGWAVIKKVAATEWFISGANLT